MKATGIVRPIDCLGRIVLPKELRKTHDINEGDKVEIFTENDGSIILRKFGRKCACCGDNTIENLRTINNVTLCGACSREFGKAAKG